MKLTKRVERVCSCEDGTGGVEAVEIKLHLVEDSSTAERSRCKRVIEVWDMRFQQFLAGTLHLVHSACAVVQERAIELQAQVVAGHPSGDAGVFITPKKFVRRNDRSHRVVVLMFAFES